MKRLIRINLFITYSTSHMNVPTHFGTQPMQSMPSFTPPRRRITVPDDNGVDHSYDVDDAMLKHVRALVGSRTNVARTVSTYSMQLIPSVPTLRFGTAPQQSLGSLPSGGSQHSSLASFGSATSQASGGT